MSEIMYIPIINGKILLEFLELRSTILIRTYYSIK